MSTVHHRRFNAASDLLNRHLADPKRASRVAIVDDQGAHTFAALAERVNRAGNALLEQGVRREERILLCLEDSVDFHAAFLGSLKIGAVPVPINTLLTTEDQGYLLQDSRATAAIVSASLYPKLAPALADAASLRTVIASGTVVGRPSFGDLLAAASPQLAPADTGPDDMAFWLYSSGSTGRPKGAVHLHSHLAQTARLYGEGVLGVGPTDVVFSAAKLFFAYGLGNALTFPLHGGARTVLRAARPTPELVLRTLAQESVTIFCGVPTLFAAMLAHADAKPEAVPSGLSLRCCISAGEALPKDIGERWRARFGVDILDGIGSTEMLHIFISNRHGEVRYGTSGKPVPGYQAKLLDDLGREIEGAGEGHLWISGPSAAASYWNNRAQSLSTFHGPWTRTGDVYRRDDGGVYTYGGRSDDMLKVGGIWVSPFEVESALLGHANVLEAAVVGCADETELIKPKAFVVLKDPKLASEALAGELKAFVKSRLAPYKYPRWIEFVRELPKTATGKIQRFKLRALMAGQELSILGAISPERATLVFLHEGLGSVGLWRDFPARCAAATGLPALIYSRQGYGASAPVSLPRPLDYMQREAREVLPDMLREHGIERPIFFGHSDGASIALVYAAEAREPRPLALALEAPHVFVEPTTTASIAAAVETFEKGDLRERLARHHGANVEGAFYGWARAWLDPGFPAALDLRPLLPHVDVPLLLIQERGDPYGTVAQLDEIERAVVGPVTRCWLPGESHSPHREHPGEVLDALRALVSRA